jgi:hypothetical protein
MRFAVDGWDPGYGRSLELEDDLGESSARVVTDVELPDERWRPIAAAPGATRPGAVLFVDGVRRVEARVWIDAAAGGEGASPAMCASYAAGTVCCCAGGAHLLTALPRRGLFTIAEHAVDVRTAAGTYPANRATPDPEQGIAVTLSAALQRRLAELEVVAAVEARAALPGHGVGGDGDLLVVDGPLRGRQHLPRALGYIKSHRSAYLPPRLHAMVGALPAGERTPVFHMGTSWERHSWYLRLPCRLGAPWAGVVRLEARADVPLADVIALANVSQVVLTRFASTEYKDSRAPQNLYPIGGLERELRRRLGDPGLLWRALRRAAV